MEIAALVLSVIAVGISALTFYRNHRRADMKLIPRGSGPPAYWLTWRRQGMLTLLYIRLPIVVVNDGGRSGAFIDGRLYVPDEWTDGRPLELNEYYPDLGSGDGTFAHPFHIGPGAAETRFAQFKVELPPDFTPGLDVGIFNLRMQARTSSRPTWHDAWTFELEIDLRSIGGMSEATRNIHWNPAGRGSVPLI